MDTVARFVDDLPTERPRVFFRSYSPAHFRSDRAAKYENDGA